MSATDDHTHAWVTSSDHDTSEGRIVYQSCDCGHWRILRRHDLHTVVATID